METFGYFFMFRAFLHPQFHSPLFLVQRMVKTLTPKHHSQWRSTVSFLPTIVRRFRSLWNEFLGPRRPHGVEADQGAIFVENDQWCFLLALLVSCAAESLICAWDVITWWFGTVGHPLIACPSCKRKSIANWCDPMRLHAWESQASSLAYCYMHSLLFMLCRIYTS